MEGCPLYGYGHLRLWNSRDAAEMQHKCSKQTFPSAAFVAIVGSADLLATALHDL
jgi:hypothetical protein